VAVAGLGFAPPFPHGQTAEPARFTRCEQCHVYRTTEKVFHANSFTGLAQDLRHGGRLYATAPPVIPHALFLREDCLACHGGPAAREAIRTTHPERTRCRQCHAVETTTAVFRPRS
jgi:cytochrome c-type protein NapB